MDPLSIMVAQKLQSFRMVLLDSSGPMVRYVPIEGTVILIMYSVFVNHMKRMLNTNDRLIEVLVFYRKKYKITSCANFNAIGGAQLT